MATTQQFREENEESKEILESDVNPTATCGS
jgi:hypothetical protein